MRIPGTFRAFVATFLPLAALGAGTLDPSFGTAGRISFDFSPAAGQAIAIQPDGKILALSETSIDPARVVVTRHNATGELDTSFGSGGRIPINFGACASCAVTSPSFVLLANGSIIVGASEKVPTLAQNNRPTNIVVTRVTSNGQIDTTFGTAGYTRINPEGSSKLHDIAVQPDGKILIAGSTGPSWLVFNPPPQLPSPAPARWLVARLDTAGFVDTFFDDRARTSPDLVAPSVAQRIAAQSTGEIVVIGKSASGLRGFRYSTTEGPVRGFTTSLKGDFADLAIDSQDRVWMLAANDTGSGLIRLSADFSSTQYGTSLYEGVPLVSVLPLPSGEAFLAGGSGLVAPQGGGLSTAGAIVKLDPQGQLDTTFGDAGRMAVDHSLVNRLALASGGRVMAVGSQDLTPAGGGARLSLMRIDPAPTVFVTTEWLSFPIQSLGTRSGTRTVTVTNPGSTSRTVSVTAPANFEAQGCTGSLAAGASCVVTITHRPTTTPAAFSFMDYATAPLAISDNGGRNATVQLYAGVEKSLVQHYYRSILRRDADMGGWDFWNSEARRVRSDVDALSGVANTNTAEAWYAMAMAFYSSAEYAGRGSNDDAFITDLYRTFFDRAPDAEGMNFWRGQITSGLPREVILLAFMFSPEFAGFNAAYFGGAANRPEIDLVMDMYRGILGRLPDPDGLRFWVQRMQAAQCQNAAAVRAEADGISSQFVQSTEYSGRNRANAQVVADLYNAFLRRAGDSSGFAFWKSGLDTGSQSRESARRAFLESPEFSARVQAVIAKGCKP